MKNKDTLCVILLTSVVPICFLIIGSFAALASSEQDTSHTATNAYISKDPSTNNGFPYPRGTAPAYGYMGCESGNTCISDKATLIHFGWAYSITPQQFVDNITKAKKLGIGKYLLNTGGPEMRAESFWKGVKNMGVTDSDFFGVYFPDEPTDPSEIIAMHTAMKKYFPNAVAGDLFR